MGWRSLRSNLPAQKQAPEARGSWVDSMLGKGSGQAALGALVRFRAAAAPAEARPRGLNTMRMRAVEESEPQPAAAPAAKSKGYLRLGLSALALSIVLYKTRPWKAIPLEGSLAWLSSPGQAKAGMPPPPPPEATPKLQVLDAGGKAVALWRSSLGAWYGVNSKGGLSRMTDSEAEASLSLPRIEGAALESEDKRSGRLLRLAVDPAQFAELLPLPDSLAAECAALQLHGGEFRLRTHSGMNAELGEGGYRSKLEKLSLVLADLGARKKRAASVDLRFENTAVVRLAAR